MKITRLLGIYALGMGLVFVLLLAWIGAVYAINVYTTAKLSAEAILNTMLTGLLSVVGLPIVHRAVYRHHWHISRKLASGELQVGDHMPIIGAEPSPPVPRVRKTQWQIALYVALYALAMASLLAAYAPFGHQEALNAFLARFSAGRSSFSSLATLVVMYAPMAIGLGIAMPLLEIDRKRMQSRALPATEVLRLQLRQDWVFSFVMSYVTVSFLAFLTGNLIISYL